MAEGKKSFMFYCDWKETFEALPNEKAGELIKHIIRYVNDENPKTDDLLIKAVFANIKATLKRDLKKWEKKSIQNSANAKVRWDKKNANAYERIKPDANHADSDSVRVSDKDKEINTKVFTYTEKDFLKDWNTIRSKHLGKESNVNRLGSFTAAKDFKDIMEFYEPQNVRDAINGLFKQKTMPKGITTIKATPIHLLKEFERYYIAFQDQNANLYGKETA